MLRLALLALGAIGAACMIAVNVRYAMATSDTEIDATIAAIYMATITLVGLTFHAVALRTWRYSRLWSILIGLVAVAAMLASLSNSLGFMAVRGSKTTAEIEKTTTAIADARAELAALRARREGLPAMPPATEASVDAAREAVAAAVVQRGAECQRRGPLCRDREADERRAREALSTAETARAATVERETIDTHIAALTATIGKAGPVPTINAQGAALATLFGLPATWADTISTWQQALLVVLMELAVIVSLIAAELMGRISPQNAQSEALTVDLKSEQGEVEVGTAKDFAVANLWPQDNGSVTLTEAYRGYCQWCQSEGLHSMPALRFAQDFTAIVRGLGLTIQEKGETIEIVGARFAETRLLAAE
jgi:hypothetical protein